MKIAKLSSFQVFKAGDVQIIDLQLEKWYLFSYIKTYTNLSLCNM